MTKMNEAYVKDFIERALQEDVGEGDHTSLACVPAEQTSKAKLLIKEAGVIAGINVAEIVFRMVDPNAKFVQLIEDGSDVIAGDVAFTVVCSSQALLKGERLALNIMQQMSGIATLSNRYKFEVEDLPVTLLDTRKTTPLMRVFEKEAVRLGGNTNYRMGLYDRFMIKDNHIDACGGVKEAIEQIMAYKKAHNIELPITIEVRNLVELYQALEVGKVDRIMLDNFEPRLLAEAVTTIDGRFETEASGGINIHNVREMAKTGVQFISIGALTHSAPNMDMSLKISKD